MLRRPCLLALASLALLPTAAPAATPTAKCPQADRANGLHTLRAGGLSCASAFAVAKRTNSVKCFLNGTRCMHRFRGRSWTCELKATRTSDSVTCKSARRVVKYRLG